MSSSLCIYRVTGNKLSWHKRHDAGIQDMRVYTAYYTITIINNGKANDSFNFCRDCCEFVFLATCDPNCYTAKQGVFILFGVSLARGMAIRLSYVFVHNDEVDEFNDMIRIWLKHSYPILY